MQHSQQTLRAVLLVLAAEWLFASMGATVKWAATALPFEMLVFARNLAGLAVISLIMWYMRVPLRPRRDTLRLHLARAALGLSAMYCMFLALAYLPLANALLLKMTAPLFIPLVAMAWLGESPDRRILWALAIGFAGVLVILRPGGEWNTVALIGLLGGALVALAKVSVRRLTQVEPVMRIVFYFALFATFLSALPLLWRWQTPQGDEWWLLAALGVFGTGAQLLLTHALRLSHATIIAPLSYASLLFGGILGFLLWQEIPDAGFVIGAVLVILAGLLVVRRRRPAPRPAPAGEEIDARL